MEQNEAELLKMCTQRRDLRAGSVSIKKERVNLTTQGKAQGRFSQNEEGLAALFVFFVFVFW